MHAFVQAAPEDPYAFFPKPADNNAVHTTVDFSDGRILRISNSPERLNAHLAATGGKVRGSTRTLQPPGAR